MTGIRRETDQTSTLILQIPGWPGHLAGQSVDIRLTAEDGYQAERSYSIASSEHGETVEITVETIEDGEVSPYLTGEVIPGDILEIRGPVGGYFVWTPDIGGPLILIGGGSGIVPLRAMLRVWLEANMPVEARLLASFRTWDDVIYRDELNALAAHAGLHLTYTLTRGAPAGWQGHRRRVDRAMLADIVPTPDQQPQIYICGPTPFVELVSMELQHAGHHMRRIRTERFGPTGG